MYMVNANALLAERVKTELGDELKRAQPDVFKVLSKGLVEDLRGKIIVLLESTGVLIIDRLNEVDGIEAAGMKRCIQVPFDTTLTLAQIEGREEVS